MTSKNQPEYKAADELIDAVMEWIGQRWTQSMIRRELKESFDDITLKTCNWLVYQAKKRIRERYNIDSAEYKGLQITFYEGILRNPAKLIDKLKAAERLDKLFGLENISTVDPAALVEKILAFKKQAQQTLEEEPSDARDKNEGDGETKDVSIQQDTSTPTTRCNGRDASKRIQSDEGKIDNTSTPTQTKPEANKDDPKEDMAKDSEALDNLKLPEEH